MAHLGQAVVSTALSLHWATTHCQPRPFPLPKCLSLQAHLATCSSSFDTRPSLELLARCPFLQGLSALEGDRIAWLWGVCSLIMF